MNDEPIVIWGPGSEWFWIMLQTVVVAITLVGIYFQFRLQRAANAFDQLNRMGEQWDSEPMLRARLGAARALAAGRDVPESSLSLIGNYWESIATLVRQGHGNEHVVAESFGNNTTIWWSAFKDSIGVFRNCDGSISTDTLVSPVGSTRIGRRATGSTRFGWRIVIS